ncbi:thermonuclease family protein [Roseateles sp. DC23W]|uniref:Thermonuclease family protein n=1 Tax=Pelomonas dachongensis TaxID=3299029 RepID=A0ABW7EUQ9_9BURK
MLVWADTVLHGRVVSVTGGDVLTLVDAQQHEYKLCLAYIDAPELGQTFGDEAQAALAAAVLNRAVTVQTEGKAGDGCMLAEVFSPDGTNVNLELVRRGLAWHNYLDKHASAMRDRYGAASMEAQLERRGMWALDRLEPPKDYRARFERVMRWWFYAIATCAALAAVAGIYAAYGPRIDAWLAKQDEPEKSRAED